VPCHMTTQITVSGKHKGGKAVYLFERTKDDSPLKARFLVVRMWIPHHALVDRGLYYESIKRDLKTRHIMIRQSES
jgi:hypothetical protein